MNNYPKSRGIVACGHPKTAEAAVEVLDVGGNAYDAIIAAYLAACVAEPVLASLGGGGYLLANKASGNSSVYDFFVQTPKIKREIDKMDFYPEVVDFGTVTQEFHIGRASIAVPGGVAGIFKINRELGKISLKEIIKPVTRMAREGVEVNSLQAQIISLVSPILKSTDEIFELFKSGTTEGELAQKGDVLKNQDFADFLEVLVKDGEEMFYKGELARKMVEEVGVKRGGHIDYKSLESYKVEVREPLVASYRGTEFMTNPLPSSGGVLMSHTMRLMEGVNVGGMRRSGVEYLKKLSEAMAETNLLREKIMKGRLAPGNTTHISVIDGEGNIASMTVTNGEGSGAVVPGTGIILNNMLGEEDLNPGGFHKWKLDTRMSSMMSPSVLKYKDGKRVVLGSGGSNRIRSAILQVVLNLIDFGMNLEQAVEYPRIHFEREVLHLEPGLLELTKERKALEGEFENVEWHKEKGVFFGGVHTACVDVDNRIFSGVGDSRRGGVSVGASSFIPSKSVLHRS